MKFENGLLKECTEKELYDLWIQNKTIVKMDFDAYKQSAIQSGCRITNEFIIIHEN